VDSALQASESQMNGFTFLLEASQLKSSKEVRVTGCSVGESAALVESRVKV